MAQQINWEEEGRVFTSTWVAENEIPPPKKILIANDQLKANTFLEMASQDIGYLWKGDYQNARQFLQALQRRIGKKAEERVVKDVGSLGERFHRHRQFQGYRARTLSRLLVHISRDLTVELRRAPEVRQAIVEAIGETAGDFIISLRALLGFISAREWRKNGIHVEALGAKIHPRYGVFFPARSEYLDLLERAPLDPAAEVAFDIGTGTGVLAMILAKRGVPKIIATDLDPRALDCAHENVVRLGFSDRVEIVSADLFPGGTADLIVCNPPWLPVKPTSSMERAVYDEGSQMLRGFLAGVGSHLTKRGEAWLIISDLAELLGLRQSNDLASWIEQAGLVVVDRLDTKPKHIKAVDTSDPLHEARSRELTSLWRLKPITDATR